jgi:hypothetical protein
MTMTTPPSSLLRRHAGEARVVGLGVRQESVNKGVGDPKDPRELGVGRLERRHSPVDHG